VRRQLCQTPVLQERQLLHFSCCIDHRGLRQPCGIKLKLNVPGCMAGMHTRTRHKCSVCRPALGILLSVCLPGAVEAARLARVLRASEGEQHRTTTGYRKWPDSELPEPSLVALETYLVGLAQPSASDGGAKALAKPANVRASSTVWASAPHLPLLVASRAVPLFGMVVDPDRQLLKAEREYWDGFFHCTSKSATWLANFTPAHTFTVLAAIALVSGTFASIVAAARGPGSHGGPSWWGPRLDYACLLASTVGGCLVYIYLQLSKVIVIVGFGYCGYFYFMFTYVAIIVCAQLFAAKEYATEATTNRGWLQRFFTSLSQWRVFLDAQESMRKGRITASLARQKFIDSVGDSGPQAVFTVYVMYCLGLRFNLALSLSIFSSVVGMACGFAVWLEFTLQQQLTEDEVPEEEFCLHWYHYCIWVSYFGTDFALRLLTLGLFLAQEPLQPYSFLVLVLLLVAYFLAAALPIHGHYTDATRKATWFVHGNEGEEEVYEVTKKAIAYRATDALIFTFLVHALPADLRLAPRTRRESRLMFVLDPDVRIRIQQFVIPLRAIDFLLLGGAAMHVNFEWMQFVALVCLFMSSQLLLLQLSLLKRPTPVASRKPLESLRRVHAVSSHSSDAAAEVSTDASP